MNISSLNKTLIALTFAIISPFTAADDASASKTIVSVLVDFQHFPSDADKLALKAIESDNSVGASIKMVAKAVSNISHSATAADKEQLTAIAADDPAKSLADIVTGINHVPSAEAKTALQALL